MNIKQLKMCDDELTRAFARRTTLALTDLGHGLFLGAGRAASDFALLQRHGITHILNVADDVPTICFHCMESARRGPRCAKRLVEGMRALRDVGYAPQPVKVAVLEGGFDQWVRRHWRDPARVEGYDDAYWGYAEDAGDGDEAVCTLDVRAGTCEGTPDVLVCLSGGRRRRGRRR